MLTSFAVEQPLFDILGRNATFFAARGSTGRDIVLLALALTIAPPVVLALAELGADALDPFLGQALHLFLVAVLSADVALQALKRTGWPASALLVAAVLLGLGGAVLYRRAGAAQEFLTLLVPAPLIFLGLFLGRSDVSGLLFGDERPERTVQPPLRTPVVQSPPPVVLIVFDEFSTVALMDRSERIDARRFPHFAALAADATWFRTATTVHMHTDQAVPAVLTGRLPPVPHRLPTYAAHPQNVFTLFATDYRLHAFEALTTLCPRSLCARARSPPEPKPRPAARAVPAGTAVLTSDLAVVYLHLALPRELAARVEPIGDSWGDFRGGHGSGRLQRAAAVDEFCGRGFCRFTHAISAGVKPSLYVLHVLLPHAPWTYLPSGKRVNGNVRLFPGLDAASWGYDKGLVLQSYQRYLLQVGYTDRLLGIVLERLRSTRLYDRAVIAVTADHGVSFRLGEPRRNVTRANFPDIAFVPLLVKLPGQRRGRIVDSFARTIDVLPTIADAANLRLPWRVDGHSLIGRVGEREGEITMADTNGIPITVRLSTLVAERRLALADQHAVFGTGPFARVFRIGPHRELLDRRVDDLPVAQRPDLRCELDGAELLGSVDLDSELVPAYVTGKIDGDLGKGAEIAVGVNGAIAATTRTYDDAGETRFAALIPERLIRAGSNDIEIFAVESRGGSLVLAELRARNPTFVLRRHSRGDVLESSQAPDVQVVPGAFRGRARAVTPGESVIFSGSAFDAAGAQPSSIVVFVDGRSIYASPAANVKLRGVERAGFQFELPRRLLPAPGDARRLRVFAIRGHVASELRYAGLYLTAGRG